jgi:glyoxylase-like metal-dependent hydrolase (beta-lactamase superfamily II)
MKSSGLTPVTDRLFIVNTPTRGRFPLAYSFLVLGSRVRALIDTGCGPEPCREVLATYDVDVVINSHCHPDHVSGNHLFAGKELWVPEQRLAEVGAVSCLCRRLVGPDPGVMAAWAFFARQGLGMEDYLPTKTFRDGDILDFGGLSLQAVHTPGHLDDHYCFLEPDENILLSFDIDLTGFGPFYGNPESDIALFKASLNRIMDIHPRVVASSHRLPVVENVREELLAFKEKFVRNEKRVSAALDVPRSLDEICLLKPIFGKYIPGLEVIYTFFERCMVEKHLEEMTQTGRVKIQDGKYSV